MSYDSSQEYNKLHAEIHNRILKGYSYEPRYVYMIDDAERSGEISHDEAKRLYDLLGKLRIASKERRSKQEDEVSKEISIENVKSRYNEKSAFWKFFHKKLNPSKMNLNSMSVEEINKLTRTIMYGEKNGRTR